MHICIVKSKDLVHSTGLFHFWKGRTDWYKDLMAVCYFFFSLVFFSSINLFDTTMMLAD